MLAHIRTFFGLLAVVLVLVSGGFMGNYLLKAERAQVTEDEWAQVTYRLAALETAVSPAPTTQVSAAIDLTDQIAINQADQNLLEELPGIGPARATDILEARQAGDFRDFADFQARVPSIPKSVFDDIATKIRFD